MADVTRRPTVRNVLLSLLGSVLLWAAVSDAWGWSSHLRFGGGAYLYAYVSRIVWAAPAAVLIARYSEHLKFGKRELFSRPVWNRHFAIALIALALSLIMALAASRVIHGRVQINDSVDPVPEIVKLLLVGVVEETVFRGWGYNALAPLAGGKKAAAYSTLFFVLLHWPAYLIRFFRSGTMDWTMLFVRTLTALVWGYLCCHLLKKGKSLWHPIFAHTVYDLLIVFFV